MTIEMSVAIIAVAFVVLVVFLVGTLLKVREDLHQTTTEAIQLMKKLDALTSDIQSKSNSLNFLFRPLKSLNHRGHNDIVMELGELVGVSLSLFEKLKAAVRHYAK